MPDFLEPVEETYTQWKNPLSQEQVVDIFHDGSPRPTRYRWAPGETKQVSSRYDGAIHRVHHGVIIGGLAPQLIKVGSDEKLDPALDTEGVAKREAEVEAARAALAKREAEDTLLVANARAAAAKVSEVETPLPPEAPKKRG